MPYASLRDFMARLEQSGRLVRVDGARLAASRDDRDPDPPSGRKGPGGAVRERRADRRHALGHPGAGQPLRHGRARGLGHGSRAQPAARCGRNACLPAPARAAGRLARGARHAAHAAHRDGDEAQNGGQRALPGDRAHGQRYRSRQAADTNLLAGRARAAHHLAADRHARAQPERRQAGQLQSRHLSPAGDGARTRP